jgi:hypothetical protein
MNIFYLDTDVARCAQYHVDRHVVKMITEYNQLLSTAHWLSGSSAPYKPTHANHPSAIWTRANVENYKYLVSLCEALCDEYSFRYQKVHKGSDVIQQLKVSIPNLPKDSFYPPTPAMPDEYKLQNSLDSYRNYYKLAKTHLFSWKNRSQPNWI